MFSVRLEKLSSQPCGRDLPHKTYMAGTGKKQIFRALTEEQLRMLIMPMLQSAQWALDSAITPGETPEEFEEL